MFWAGQVVIVVGISKETPLDKGHVVVELLFGRRNWVLVDPKKAWIDLMPKLSCFYKEYHLVGKGLDSWDLGIKTFADWESKAKEFVR